MSTLQYNALNLAEPARIVLGTSHKPNAIQFLCHDHVRILKKEQVIY